MTSDLMNIQTGDIHRDRLLDGFRSLGHWGGGRRGPVYGPLEFDGERDPDWLDQ